MTPISEYARRFDLVDNTSYAGVVSALIAWTLHTLTTSHVKRELRKHVKDQPGFVAEQIIAMRSDLDIFMWKIDAIRFMLEESNNLFRFFRGEAELKEAIRDHNIILPEVFQTLDVNVAAAEMKQALTAITPVIGSLVKNKLRFAEKIYHVHPWSILYSRAIMTWRWAFPFMRNAPAHLNTAVSNYANNIARDVSTDGRSVNVIDSESGEFSYRLAFAGSKHIAEGSVELSSQPEIEDLRFDIGDMSDFEKKVIHHIVYHDTQPKDLASAINASQESVDAALIRIKSYLTDGGYAPGFGEGNAHQW